jgi:hypothetical protein
MNIHKMIQELCDMRRESEIAGDPPHLYTYYYDAIQAMQRLATQINNINTLRDRG